MKTYTDYEKRLVNNIMDRPDWPVEKETSIGWMVTERPLVMIQGDLNCRLQTPLDADGKPLVDGGKYSIHPMSNPAVIKIDYEQFEIWVDGKKLSSFFDCRTLKKHVEEKVEEKHDGFDHLRKEADEWINKHTLEKTEVDCIGKEHHCTIVNNPPVKKINGVLCYPQYCLECGKTEWVPVPEETTEPVKEQEMVICENADKCKYNCVHHKKPHKKYEDCFDPCNNSDGGIKGSICVTVSEFEKRNQTAGWEDIYSGNETEAMKALEELEKWMPRHGEEYYYWNFDFCSPIKTTRTPCHNDFSNVYFGNCFRTEDECREWAKREGLG